MKISYDTLETLKDLEKFVPKAYIPVPGDVPTIGYGFTRGVRMGDTMTKLQADKRLLEELLPYEAAVAQGCTVTPNQNQFDAMVLLCYNIGINGFKRSSVLKAHNRRDFLAASRAFGLWNKSGGKVYRGLTRRRAMEAALYLKPVAAELAQLEAATPAVEAMPQSVDAESTMAQSPINRAGVAAGGTAAVAAVAETARTVADVKSSATMLGEWLVPVLLVAVIGLCGYMIWQRYNQRKEGWT